MDKNKALENKKNVGIIIALGVAIVVGIAVLVIAVVSMSSADKPKTDKSDKGSTEYTLAPMTDNTSNSLSDDDGILGQSLQSDGTVDNGVSADNNGSGLGNANSVQAGDAVTVADTVKNTVGYDPIAEYKTHTNNGDNILSDYHENKYIKLVADKYNVNTDLLVAIYSEPDVGSNFVLEFSGKKDSDGNYIKSPDTLEKVYQIDKAKNISVATGKPTGNIGVSYAEGTLCFYMVKTVVMKQYPDYFTGV